MIWFEHSLQKKTYKNDQKRMKPYVKLREIEWDLNYLPPVLHFRFKTPNVRGTLERAGEFQTPNKGPRSVPPIIFIF